MRFKFAAPLLFAVLAQQLGAGGASAESAAATAPPAQAPSGGLIARVKRVVTVDEEGTPAAGTQKAREEADAGEAGPCYVFVWDVPSAVRHRVCRRLIHENSYVGRQGTFVRIHENSPLKRLWPLDRHKPDACVLCGHTRDKHVNRLFGTRASDTSVATAAAAGRGGGSGGGGVGVQKDDPRRAAFRAQVESANRGKAEANDVIVSKFEKWKASTVTPNLGTQVSFVVGASNMLNFIAMKRADLGGGPDEGKEGDSSGGGRAGSSRGTSNERR